MVSIIKDLAGIQGYSGVSIPEKYLMDSVTGNKGTATAVVFPKNVEEIKKVVLLSAEKKVPLIFRGAGTGLTGATVPLSDEIIVDISNMNRILDFDEETLTLSVEPGVTLIEIQQYVEKKGYFYPPDPGSKEATIGGTVATNAGGMRAVKYGVTRDYVRSLSVILASGESLKLGSLTEKNSSGYDLKDLFIGSEGTLGIITSIQLKVIPLPKVSKSVILGFPTLRVVSSCVLDILKSEVAPTALEFFEKEAIEMSCHYQNISFPLQKSQAFLLLTLDGPNQVALAERFKTLEKIAQNHQISEQIYLDDPKLAGEIWVARGGIVSAVESMSQQEPIDIVVLINRIPATIDYMKELSKGSGLPFVCFGHAGDGNIHACIMRKDLSQEQWETKLDQVLAKLYHYVASIGGLPSAEHGIGRLKRSYFLAELDDTYLSYLRAIRKVFDPDGRLNPQKVL